jgi:hypothetical protein
MANDGESSEDRWAERRRQRREARPRYLTRDLGRRLLVAGAAGLIAGLALHVLDSAPQVLSFAAVAVRFMAGILVFGGVLVGLARLVMQSQPEVALGTVAFGIAALVGYPLGPTWIPAATVSGTYSLTFQGTTLPVVTGALTCDWLPGRWQIGDFVATAPVGGPGGERILLRASFAQRQVGIERTAIDGTPRAPYTDASQFVLEPPLLVTGEPQRTADGRSGTTVVHPVIDTSSPPAGAPAQWTSPLAVDGATGISLQVTWDCAAP